MIFWHIPSVFDFATLHESFHILQHILFIIVGAAGFLAIRSLGESFSIFLLFTITGIMGFASLAFAVSDNPIYSVYSVNSHHDAGTYAGFVHADNSNCSASISNRKSTVSY